jgi:hypothetical protein
MKIDSFPIDTPAAVWHKRAKGEINMTIEFQEFGKIARLSRNCTITEKIDGTNGCIAIVTLEGHADTEQKCIYQANGLAMYCGSRSRWITPEDDNYGFAKWVKEHAEELAGLGEGRHFGEWWGQGIQRRYDQTEKRFSLFNTSRWNQATPQPSCCSVVPVLYSGVFTSTAVDESLDLLRMHGSIAAPGFMRPEGVVVYQSAGRCYFKKTLERDDEPKGKHQ